MSFKKLGILGCISLASIVGNVGMNSICCASNQVPQPAGYDDYVLGIKQNELPKDKELIGALEAKHEAAANAVIDTGLGTTLTNSSDVLGIYIKAYLAIHYPVKENPAAHASLMDPTTIDWVCAKAELDKILSGETLGLICECDPDQWKIVEDYIDAVNKSGMGLEFTTMIVRKAEQVVVGKDNNAQTIDLKPIYLCKCIKRAGEELTEEDMQKIQESISAEITKLLSIVDGCVNKDEYLKTVMSVNDSVTGMQSMMKDFENRVKNLESDTEELSRQVNSQGKESMVKNNGYRKNDLISENSNNWNAQSNFNTGKSNFNTGKLVDSANRRKMMENKIFEDAKNIEKEEDKKEETDVKIREKDLDIEGQRIERNVIQREKSVNPFLNMEVKTNDKNKGKTNRRHKAEIPDFQKKQ